MSIADQISRLNNAKASIKESIINKGVVVSDTALLDEYPALIDSIQTGGGDPYYENFYNLRTSNGISMRGMFSYCNIPELDLRSLDVSKVTDMTYMFYIGNTFTASMDFSKLDFSSLTKAEKMFYGTNTDKFNLTGLSFPGTTKLNSMFNGAKGTTLDLSSWDISNITNMYQMFYSAEYRRIDLTGWKTTNVTDMYQMFNKYSSPLEELIIPDWDMANVTSASGFFYTSNMPKLSLVDLSRSDDYTISRVTSALPTKTATTFGDVLVPSNTSQDNLNALMAKYWRPIGADLTPAPTSAEIIAELDELKPGKPKTTRVYISNCEPWYGDPSKVEIVMTSSELIATMEGDTITTVQGADGGIELEIRVIDTQEVIGTKTINIWNGDSYPNVVKWRTSEPMSTLSYDVVLNINGTAIKGNNSSIIYDKYLDMYTYDAGQTIEKIKFSSYYNKIKELVKINTSNIYSMEEMFYGGTSLVSLDLSDWDTSNVTSMSDMFQDCTSLVSLNLSGWDTSNVTNMKYVFQNCTSLVSLDVSNWDTSKVTDMSNMFQGCTSLVSLDLSDWDTSKVTNMGNTFHGCTSLMNFNPPKNFTTGSFDVLYFEDSPLLTYESLMSIINSLTFTALTKQVRFNKASKDKLTEEEIAIATNKGWSLSFR